MSEVRTITSPRLKTPEQAAKDLSISRATTYKLIKSGELESVKIGRSRRVPDAAIANYIGRLRAEATGAAA